MTPRFALAVDPIFLHVLGLLDRISRGEEPPPQDERLKIRALVDQGEALVGTGPEWDSAKYAIVSWIDEVLVDTAWNGQDWWSNNVLEVEFYRTRVCSEQFFVRAREASTLPTRDALEVFYVCVILGFRGLYRDPEVAGMLVESHNLPADLETWAKQVSMSIRLGQGRPALSGPAREIAGAPPLAAKASVVWPWMVAAMLAVTSVVCYWFWNRTWQ